jgi:hypothetical protein
MMYFYKIKEKWKTTEAKHWRVLQLLSFSW